MNQCGYIRAIMGWALKGVCKVEDSHRAFIHVSAKVQFSSASWRWYGIYAPRKVHIRSTMSLTKNPQSCILNSFNVHMFCEPVWPSGKALGWEAEGPRFESASALLSLQKLRSAGHCLVTLSLTINETLKWLSSLPVLIQESFWWWQCCDRYI